MVALGDLVDLDKECGRCSAAKPPSSTTFVIAQEHASSVQRTVRLACATGGDREGAREARVVAHPGRRPPGEAQGARMRGLKRLALFVLLVVACARMAPPPGGPRRLLPAKLVGTFPDSGVAPCDFRGAAEFRFDEVTDEGTTPNFGTGTGTLEQLVMFSPDTLVPVVEWHRDRITVKPRGGWRPNHTYRIELVAGLRDLHGNLTKSGHTIAFTTCGPRLRPGYCRVAPPTGGLRRAPVGGALIEAYHLPDSARYRTVADSSGRFRMTELPAGPYLVVATVHPGPESPTRSAQGTMGQRSRRRHARHGRRNLDLPARHAATQDHGRGPPGFAIDPGHLRQAARSGVAPRFDRRPCPGLHRRRLR